jgi:hypothetical protein
MWLRSICGTIDLEFNHLKRDGSFVLRSERSGSEIGLHDAFRMCIPSPVALCKCRANAPGKAFNYRALLHPIASVL